MGWAAIDQFLSSASNVALGFLLAHELTRDQFGAFGLIYATYMIALLTNRGVGSTVLQVRFSVASDEQPRAIRDSAGVAVVVAAAFAVPVLVFAWVEGGTVGRGLLVLAIVLVPLLVQDAWRVALFTVARPKSAAINDLVWIAVQAVALGGLLLADHLTLATAIAAWGCGAVVAALLGMRQTRSFPALRGARKWLIAHRDLGVYQAAEFILIAGTNPAILLILATVASLRDIAALRAAQLVVSPLNLALAAVLLIALPELSRIYTATPDRLPRVLDVSGLLFAAAALAFGVLVSLLPATVGRALVGPNWKAARPLLMPFAVQYAALGFTTAWLMGLRVLQAARAAFLLQLSFAPLYVAGAVVGVLVAGPFGAACGLAAASILSMLPMRAVALRRFTDARRSA